MQDTEYTTRARILVAGREEFLKKGYQDASMRNIAAKAGVTTGAIYGKYADKGALFAALVEPAASEFAARLHAALSRFEALPPTEQTASMFGYASQALAQMLNFVYEHFDAFRLVVCRASGTPYEDYMESLVRAEEAATLRFADVLRRAGHPGKTLSPNLVHILCRAYFSAVFETVAHNMEKDEADAYVAGITEFFSAGWRQLFGMK